MINNSAEAKKKAIDYISTWEEVQNPRVENVEMKKIGEPEMIVWHVTGVFTWTKDREGLFSFSIHESGDFLGWSVAASKVGPYESVPSPY